ncbi:MAG TPA: Gfo/Idh/MocA family oxidoreductase [Vicinamibacterales bacterium]|nr:Gfo/Idh/MocA family oxidoreductase [Vicinamibacterales bacterium]
MRVSPIDVGVVGAGRLAQHVLFGVLRRMPGVRVTAIVEPESGRRAIAQQHFPAARIAASLDALLSGERPDALIISSPPSTHAELARLALHAGLHVYVEKPLATDLQAAESLVELARSSGRVTMVGFNYRRHPLVVRLREAIAAGRVGTPLAIQTVFSVAHTDGEGWRAGCTNGGGALFELGSHHIDLVRFLFGSEIAYVSARVWSRRHDSDTASVQLALTSGAEVSLFLAIGAADQDLISVVGDQGAARLDRLSRALLFDPRVFRYDRQHAFVRGGAATVAALRRAVQRPGEPSYAHALAAFAAGIRNGGHVQPDLVDGLRSLEVVDAAMRSSKEGRRVTLGRTLSGVRV